MANVYAGEIGIHAGGRDYTLRPSFRALADIGSPKELVDIYNTCHRPDSVGFAASLSVLHSMCDAGPEVFGYHRDVKGRLRYIRGLITEPQDIPVLARAILKNGMVGTATGRGQAARKFDPSEFVGTAIAHLGIAPADAWDMTMLELQAVINAKTGDSKSNVPTAEELDELERAVYGDDA